MIVDPPLGGWPSRDHICDHARVTHPLGQLVLGHVFESCLTRYYALRIAYGCGSDECKCRVL